jgi:hypothetical protein
MKMMKCYMREKERGDLKKKKIKEGLALSAESNEMALILSE